jgi:hypothetical protein
MADFRLPKRENAERAALAADAFNPTALAFLPPAANSAVYCWTGARVSCTECALGPHDSRQITDHIL